MAKRMKKRTPVRAKPKLTPYERLSVKSFGLAFAIVFMIVMAGIVLLEMFARIGTTKAVASIYPGIAATSTGILIAAAWGFVMGLIFGSIVAWLYNLLT